MKNFALLIGWTFLLIAIGAYVYGIYLAIHLPGSIPDPVDPKKWVPNSLPIPFDTITSSLGALFLTNFGAVLGVSVTRYHLGLSSARRFQILIPDPMTQRQLIQYIAVGVYLVSLIICSIYWIIQLQVPDTPAHPRYIIPIISEYGKTLIGVVTAYLAVVLGIQQSKPALK